MVSFADTLRQAPPIILDGGLASELERRGLQLDRDLWSARLLIDSPQSIEAVHYDYFAAGAQVATTASYQASYEGFAAIGIGAADATALFQRSVEVALSARSRFVRDVAGREEAPGEAEQRAKSTGLSHLAESESAQGQHSLFVAGSLGTYGAVLHDGSEYRGDFDLSEKDLISFHARRAEVLLDAGADVLACETIPQLREAVALAQVVSGFGADIAWVSLTTLDGIHTPRGEHLSDCALALDDYVGVCAIGVNCLDANLVATALQSLREGTDKPLLAYPNRGGRWDAVAKRWVGGHSSSVLAIHAAEWIERGARAIGGCCRTTPEDITSLAAACGRTLGSF